MIEFASGQRLCNCTLLYRCGSGAYGEVWLAEDEIGGRVALKIVPNGGRYSDREIAGLRNYRDCDHPNLLRIRHIEITPEFLFYTMDAADDLHHGKGDFLPDTLANRLRQFNRLDGAEIFSMLEGLLAGLTELHRHHLVHRDIKPDNILWIKGRPTLADAGLIAPSGAGSLVGTPGFLSPRLLSGKGFAEPEDDFYALGKVVYCALTGNPVEEYPSIPREMTLSGNADWNRLFREICESPVASAAEFRERMQFRAKPSHRKWWLRSGIALLLLMGIASFFFLWKKSSVVALPDTTTNATVETPVVVPQDTLPVEALRKWNDRSDPVLSALRTAGLYDREQLAALLNVPWYSQSDFFSRLEKCGQNPRMMGFPRYYTGKKASPLEKELMTICRDYQECRLGDLKARQFYWQSRQGDSLVIQRIMLATDPVMQVAAFDHLVFEKIDAVLASGKFENQDKTQLKAWIQQKNVILKEKLQNPRPKKEKSPNNRVNTVLDGVVLQNFHANGKASCILLKRVVCCKESKTKGGFDNIT